MLDALPKEFPPRYAGMEDDVYIRPARGRGFPRATRGWKVAVIDAEIRKMVSPALRWDGRVLAGDKDALTLFPPRYAGMEGRRSR